MLENLLENLASTKIYRLNRNKKIQLNVNLSSLKENQIHICTIFCGSDENKMVFVINQNEFD